MDRPFKYFILCNETKKVVRQTNTEPTTRELQSYVSIGNGASELKQTKTAYIDERYEAKLRLFNYITYERFGFKVPSYEPYKNTEIGKSIPILNF